MEIKLCRFSLYVSDFNTHEREKKHLLQGLRGGFQPGKDYLFPHEGTELTKLPLEDAIMVLFSVL